MYGRFLLIGVIATLLWGMWASAGFQEVAAGVAVFLFGMLLLEEGFSAFSGGPLERVLSRATSSLPRSISFGVASTSLMQSSSLVSVLTISFLSAGLLGLREGIGIIFGANIGTTTGAWLMAGLGMKVKISAYAMPMLVFGLLFVMQKGKALAGLGRVLAGMGFLFLGIHFMKSGFEGLQGSVDLAAWAMPGFVGLVVFALLGAVATVIMQSSHATLMLIIAALAAGQITYEGALALAIGANVGTTVTAVLGSLGANAVGKQLAGAHLVFNVVTGLIAVLAMPLFKGGVEVISDWIGFAADDWTLRLAVFHTLFNVVGVVVMTPAITPLVRLLEGRFAEEEGASGVRFLNEAALALPSTALEVLSREARRLFDSAFGILAHGVGLHRGDILSRSDMAQMLDFDPKLVEENVLDAYYREVKTGYAAIVDFMARAQPSMNAQQLEEAYALRTACGDIARAVKEMTLMMLNIERYVQSDNKAMRAGYKELRLEIARALRRLYEIKATEEPAVQLVAFERLARRVAEREAARDQRFDGLVRGGHISTAMATSLMNDDVHASQVVRSLLDAAKRLFVPRGSSLLQLHDEMLVDDSTVDSRPEGLETHPQLAAASLTGEMRRIRRGEDGT